MPETRYQRVAREQAERQAARKKRMAAEQRKARRRSKPAPLERRPVDEISDDLGGSPDR